MQHFVVATSSVKQHLCSASRSTTDGDRGEEVRGRLPGRCGQRADREHVDGLDGRVALWDGKTGALLGSVVASPNVATAAGFARDGHTVVIASTDGTVARWDTDVEQWISAACGLAGRGLTAAEWAAVLPDRPYVDTCS